MTPARAALVLASRLRAARDDAGLSQREVADELDLQRPSVSEMEAGRRAVGALELAALARLYRVPVASLLEDL